MKTLFKTCLLLASLLLPHLARAQYSIDWYTIDGGGGTSTGSVYSVSGTIGQPDAGTMAGGNYTLQGGFWGLLLTGPLSGAPPLAILRSTTNTAIVYWPSPSTGWTLQQNTNALGTVNWSNITTGILDDGINKKLVVDPPIGNRYYRLIK